MFNLNEIIMKFKLLEKLMMLSKYSLTVVLVQCLFIGTLMAANNNTLENTKLEGENVNQGTTVTGVVTSSEDDSGIPGANVIVKGTSTGTVTDIEGNYSLEVPDDNATIVFSSVGFSTAEVVVGNRSTIDITLNVDFTQLDEIIVVGYGEQKRATVTGAVASVDGDLVREFPTNNVSGSLVGQVAGLMVVNRSGEPAAEGIRG